MCGDGAAREGCAGRAQPAAARAQSCALRLSPYHSMGPAAAALAAFLGAALAVPFLEALASTRTLQGAAEGGERGGREIRLQAPRQHASGRGQLLPRTGGLWECRKCGSRPNYGCLHWNWLKMRARRVCSAVSGWIWQQDLCQLCASDAATRSCWHAMALYSHALLQSSAGRGCKGRIPRLREGSRLGPPARLRQHETPVRAVPSCTRGQD